MDYIFIAEWSWDSIEEVVKALESEGAKFTNKVEIPKLRPFGYKAITGNILKTLSKLKKKHKHPREFFTDFWLKNIHFLLNFRNSEEKLISNLGYDSAYVERETEEDEKNIKIGRQLACLVFESLKNPLYGFGGYVKGDEYEDVFKKEIGNRKILENRWSLFLTEKFPNAIQKKELLNLPYKRKLLKNGIFLFMCDSPIFYLKKEEKESTEEITVYFNKIKARD